MKTTKRPARIIGTLAAGAVLATGTLAVAAPGAGAAPEASASACTTESWPANVNGRPAVHPGATGVYLWHGTNGWKLRVNEPGADRAVFTGTIRVDGQLVSWGRHLENRGEGTVTRVAAGRAAFRFVNYGGVDGLDFVTRCSSTVRIRVKVDGVAVPASQIFIGADGHHPSSLPTTITRGA